MTAIDDLADQRLADYRGLRERGRESDEYFIVEGVTAIERLLTSPYPVRSVLLTPATHARLARHLGTAETYVVSVEAMAAFDNAPLLDARLDELNLFATDIGQITVTSALDAAPTSVGSVLISDIPVNDTNPNDGAYGRRDLVVDCAHGFDCTNPGATLGQARTAGALRPGAHLQDVGRAFRDHTVAGAPPISLTQIAGAFPGGLDVNDVIVGSLDQADFPWEDVDLATAGLQDFARTGSTLDWSLEISISSARGGPGPFATTVAVTLPPGFRYFTPSLTRPAPAELNTLTPTAGVLTRPTTSDGPNGQVLQWTLGDLLADTDYTLSFRTTPGLELGVATMVAKVSIGNGAATAAGQVGIIDTTDASGSPATALPVEGDVLYLGYVDHGTLTGTGPTVTYTSAAAFSGSDSFTYAVNDGHVQSTSATVSITVTAPSRLNLAWTDNASRTNASPLSGAVLRAGVSAYIFTTTDLTGLRQVSFSLDGVPFSTDRSTPFDFAGTSTARVCRLCVANAFPFESNLLSVGAHHITAVALLRDGSTVTTDSQFTVTDTTTHSLAVSTSPSRTSPSPLAGATLSGVRYVFLGDAGDPIAGLGRVVFQLDGRNIATDSSAPYDAFGTRRGVAAPFDTRRLRNGNHRIVAVVQLAGGGRIVYSATFRVAN